MRKGKILKGAIVLLITVALISTTAVTADTVKETDENQMDTSCIKSTNSNPSKGNEVQPLGPVIFSQLPFEPEEEWIFYTSSNLPGYLVYDNFWGIEEPICDIHWWGLSLVNPWAPCDPTGIVFEIIFYTDSGGEPGDPVCAYQVTPPATPTGKFYAGFEMYYWETDLDPCCQLDMGWVSIQSISSPNGCWFLWAGSDDGDLFAIQDGADPPELLTDLAFELTKEGPDPIPAICCDPGIMNWEVGPDKTVTGTFHVWNCGDDGSTLTWSVDSYPPWMTAAAFTPNGGNIAAPGPGTDVTYTFTAPSQQQTYSGVIKVINVGDPTDFCEMPVELIVPRSKGVFFNIFEYIVNQFPILKTLFGF